MRTPVELEASPGADHATALAGDHARHVVPRVGVAFAELIRPHHDGVIQQRSISFWDRSQPLDKVAKLLRVPPVDADQLVHCIGVSVPFVREVVMTVVEPEPGET